MWTRKFLPGNNGNVANVSHNGKRPSAQPDGDWPDVKAVAEWIAIAKGRPASRLGAIICLAACITLLVGDLYRLTGFSYERIIYYLGSVQTLIAVGIASCFAYSAHIKSNQERYVAALEGLAQYAVKAHLGTLIRFLPTYEGIHEFDHTLEGLLSTVTEEDAGLFSRHQQSVLVRCFAVFLNVRNDAHAFEKKSMAYVILHALAEAGDKASLAGIEEALDNDAQVDSRIVEAELIRWKARLEHQNTANTLLRASKSSSDNMLLIPVSGVDVNAQDAVQLLRADNSMDA